jgi:MFS family permease
MVTSANGRNIALLSLSQACFMTTVNINIIVTSLVGVLIAPEPWLATLPISLMYVVSMLTTLPASLLMGRIGRKPVFVSAAGIGMMCCLIMGYATILSSFMLFLLSSAALGLATGVAQFYRYAAADNAEQHQKAKALSLVLAGGVLAAIIGPNLARMTFEAIPNHLYAGCFFGAAMMQFLALCLLLYLNIKPHAETALIRGTSIGWLFRQPYFIAGMLTAALGYGVMTFMMTATPLQIVNTEQMGNANNAIIIQWHVLAMLLPSLATGALIGRIGVIPILWAGVIFYVSMIAVTLTGSSFWHYLVTLILLGLGWNMLFVGGSSIIAQSCRPDQRPKVQGMADFMITAMMALASLTSATIHYLYGWKMMVLLAVVLVGVIAVSIILAMLYPMTQNSEAEYS